MINTLQDIIHRIKIGQMKSGDWPYSQRETWL